MRHLGLVSQKAKKTAIRKTKYVPLVKSIKVVKIKNSVTDAVLGLWLLGLGPLDKLLASDGSHARVKLLARVNFQSLDKAQSPKAKALITYN